MSYNPNIHHRRSIRLKGYDYSQAGLYFITICAQDRACLFGKISTGKMILNDAGKMVETEWLKLTERFPNIELHEYVVMPNHFHGILQIVEPVGSAIVGAPLVGAQMCDPNETEIGRPQGHAPTGAQMCDPNDMDAQNNGDVQNETDFGNDNGLENDGREKGRPQGHAPTVAKMDIRNVAQNTTNFRNENGRNDGDETDIGESHDIGRPQGHAPTVAPNKTVGDMLDAFKSITTVEYIHGVKQSGWEPFNGKLWQRNYWEHIIRDEQSYQTISEYITDNPAKWKGDKFYNQ